MKVPGSTPNYINQTYTNQANQGLNTPATQQVKTDTTIEESGAGKTGQDPQRTDSIQLSETTRDLQKIDQAMDNQPTDREKRVQELKEQVQNNQYTVDAQKVAAKMIGSIIDGST